MKEQINVPICFNKNNLSHITLLNWIDQQTTNRSAFIRETVLMRMMGLIGRSSESSKNPFSEQEPEIDIDEALRIIQI
jgi:hypothetical protein